MRLPDFDIERYFARYEFSTPYLLCASDVEGIRLGELLALADEESLSLWNELNLGYTETPGHPRLRQEIAELYDHVGPEDVYVFNGAGEAIFILANVLVERGDHAIVVWPAYQSLYEVARAVGAKVDLLELRPEDGWELDLDELRRLIRPNTKLVVVNFPHSPTGYLPDRATFDAIVDTVEGAGAHLLSDEVYRYLEQDTEGRLPAAVDRSSSAISVGVLSKAFGLAGLRIGWLATRDRALLRRVASFRDYTTLCNSAPSEILAIAALRARASLLERSRRLLADNLEHVDRFFTEYADLFTWIRPRAGSTGFPRLIGEATIDDTAAALVERAGVLILPGRVYGYGNNHFRLGFGRVNLPEALRRLQSFADENLRPQTVARR